VLLAGLVVRYFSRAVLLFLGLGRAVDTLVLIDLNYILTDING
jgi:hypothetical protein